MVQPDQGEGDGQERTRNNMSGTQSLILFLQRNQIEFLQLVLRLPILLYVILFFIPLWGNRFLHYKRALLCYLSVSLLRLHQRMPPFQLTKEYFFRMAEEDSAHYALFSLIFLFAMPLTLVMVPVFVISFLHALSFIDKVFNAHDRNSMLRLRSLLMTPVSYQVPLLKFSAVAEILLMPIVVLSCFSGRTNLFCPVVYFNFLKCRYASKRNHLCRQIFSEMKTALLTTTSHPSCPSLVKNVVIGSINFISKLAPAS